MAADLHCHTSQSDGSMSVDDLIFTAGRLGLRYIAVTDHDTMDGVPRAVELGRKYGVSVVPGAELSCYDYSRRRKVHILCYLPERPERLQGIFDRVTNERTRAVKESLSEVLRLYPVSEEQVTRYSPARGALYRVHIMRALISLGYDTRMYGDLYKELFDPVSGKLYRKIHYPDVYEALEAVRDAGGVAVLAHPLSYNSMELLRELAEKGLIHGAEVYHPSVRDNAEKEIEAVADQYGLLKTGGSDFHGFYSKRPLACRTVSSDVVEALYERQKKLA